MLNFFSAGANKLLGTNHTEKNFSPTDPRKICWAVRAGRLDLVKRAIAVAKAGKVNLNKRADWFESKGTTLDLTASSYLSDCTPLCVASYTPGRSDIVKALLASGCIDINAKSGRRSDHTPLDAAVLWNADLAVLNLLQDNGGRVSAVHGSKLNKLLHNLAGLPSPTDVLGVVSTVKSLMK